MKITKAKVVYNLLINIPVSSILTITAQFLTHQDFIVYWQDFVINFAISFPIAMMIGLFMPLMGLGKWFTAAFGVKNDTYTHNMAYRLLATFFISVIYSLILSPLSYLINQLIFNPGFSVIQYIFDCLKTIPVMIGVGFMSSLFFDIPAYRVAHKIDPEF